MDNNNNKPGSDQNTTTRQALGRSKNTWGVKIRSVWFLVFGMALGPCIIFFGRDPEGDTFMLILLSLLCFGIILHRLGLGYELDSRHLKMTSWWGRGSEQEVSLAYVMEVRPVQGFFGSLLGYGNLEVCSDAVDESLLMVLGQTKHLELAREIEASAQAARQPRVSTDSEGEIPDERT